MQAKLVHAVCQQGGTWQDAFCLGQLLKNSANHIAKGADASGQNGFSIHQIKLLSQLRASHQEALRLPEKEGFSDNGVSAELKEIFIRAVMEENVTIFSLVVLDLLNRK